MTYRSLGELEDAQDQIRATAQRRIELADEYVAHYRSRIHLVQESFYELSARQGIADDPGFRAELQRISDLTDQTVRSAGHRIAELEEDYEAMMRQHALERDSFIEEQRREE
ncbi:MULTISPECIES: hypothetical protein [unclassified Leifsonia]|uniref:hypothetical protein n=1 Tax=unclassified Leifsonia TaxID=2663824 RepID=UPI0008A76931|nr:MULTISPECIES: hypothetical protein [unclassified Leifsonia]SEI16172.1 hypothetical protein SAMN04515694_12431 [Leifsonia sp. CL154]SFM05902.1 hypothetical protein SAMN04515692_12427 [Leifsonia sp. CL147]